MTDLSPAQKALSAFIERQPLSLVPVDNDWIEPCLAAALESVADQVVPEQELPIHARGTSHWYRAIQRAETHAAFFAIAAELRGNTPTETP